MVKVVKFGGSSIANAEQVRKVREIIAADPKRRLVVVSAPGRRSSKDVKVTDLLILCARLRLSDRDAGGEVSRVIARYEEMAAELGIDVALTQEFRDDLCSRLDQDTSHAERFEDGIKAVGEIYSAKLLAAYLRHTGIDAEYVDPREAGLIVSEEYASARVREESYSSLAKLRDRKGVTVFPGFFGYTRDGHIVTFSRGGSDLTGAILAAAVGAEVYENFTDVDGIASADPAIVENPVLMKELTYRELRELSSAGFSVFHDEAMLPVLEAQIPINVRNTNNPSHPGTWVVVARRAPNGSIVGIACQEGFCGIYVGKYLMNREKGFGRRLLKIIEEEDLSFDHMPSGMDNITVILKESQLNTEAIERIKGRIERELGADTVTVERGITLVSIVGDGMRKTVGLAARVTGAIARNSINMEMLLQGPSELAMILGVKTEDGHNTVRAVYNEFFGKK